MPAATSRSRPPCCSRCTAAPRHTRSRRTTRRSTPTSTSGSPFAARDCATIVPETAGVDLGRASEGELRAALKRKDVPEADQLAGAKLVDEVFKNYVEPTLVQPTFVLDYPVALSPLAKLKR